MSVRGAGHIVQKRYKADITVGALKLPESRRIADLLLCHVDAEGWKDAIVSKNILQARTLTTARRLASLIRRRLETMGPDVWILVRDGHGRVASHAVFSAAVKHSPLLRDFLQFVVGEQYRLFRPALSSTLFTEYLHGRGFAEAVGSVIPPWPSGPTRHADGSNPRCSRCSPKLVTLRTPAASRCKPSILPIPCFVAWRPTTRQTSCAASRWPHERSPP